MKVIITAYSSLWKNEFEEEQKQLEIALNQYVESIEHIGSTAVEGLSAKPIIDILVGLKTFSKVDDFCIEPMMKLGYTYVDTYNHIMPYRRFFYKKNEQQEKTHHVHMVEIDSPFWKRHIFFRDYLRNNEVVKQAYEKLKLDLAAKDWEDTNDYAGAKTSFIRQIEAYQEN